MNFVPLRGTEPPSVIVFWGARGLVLNTQFLHRVFDDQPGQYIGISTKIGTRWRDHFFEELSEAIDFINKLPSQADIYFCPTRLTQPRRKKENVAKSRFLWADLDEVDPSEINDDLRPSIAWRSSPGRFQGLWELDRPYAPKMVEK